MNKLTFDFHSKFFQLFGLCGLSLILGIAFNTSFFQKVFGVNLPIFILLGIVFGIILAVSYRVTIPKLAYLFFGIAFFFALLVCIRANALLTFCNISAMFFFLLLGIIQVTDKTPKSFAAFDYWKTTILPVFFVPPFLKTLQEVLTLKANNKPRDVAMQIIRGSMATLVVVAVLLLLFASADLVIQDFFQNILSNSFDVKHIPELVSRAFFILFIGGVALGMYAYCFRHPRIHLPEGDRSPVRFVKAIELGLVLLATNIVFLTFLIIQATNLFGGHATLDRLGITYAEYAQRGFFELIAAALFVALILWIADKYSVKNTANEKTAYLFFSSLLLVQTIILMASAFYRLALYEGAYGFTTLRLFSHAFIIWMAIALVFFLVKIWLNQKEELFALATFSTGVILLIGLNLLNPDAYMAKEHIERFSGTAQFDADFLSERSADAIPVIYKAMLSEESTSATYEDILRWWVTDRSSPLIVDGQKYNRNFVGWQAYHFSRAKAFQLLFDISPQGDVSY
ncbi:MAG: DUF4173 domain-containing protein [Patescibacteria group bacterium]